WWGATRGAPGAWGVASRATPRCDETPAVAPPAHAEPGRIGQSLRYHVVDRPEHVLCVLVPPVGVDRRPVALTATRAAARVRDHHDVAVCREHLEQMAELVLELGDRAAVDAENRGMARSRPRVRRLHDEAVDRRAVAALEGDGLRGCEPYVRQPRVVLVRQRA